MAHKTCVYCGGDDMTDGSVQSTGMVRFRPHQTKFVTFRTSDIEVSSQMCVRCGAIHLRGDLEKLRELQMRS